MALTLVQAQAQLDAYLAASLKVAEGQSYTVLGRSLTRADGAFINEMIDKWQAKVDQLTATAAGQSAVTLADFT